MVVKIELYYCGPWLPCICKLMIKAVTITIIQDNYFLRIDEDSPFWKMSPKELLASNFEIIVTLDSVIESTGNTTQARSSYLPNEILWGFRYLMLIQILIMGLNYHFQIWQSDQLCTEAEPVRHWLFLHQQNCPRQQSQDSCVSSGRAQTTEEVHNVLQWPQCQLCQLQIILNVRSEKD